MKIGFIGLGYMGAAAAANIRRHGYELCVHDLDQSRAKSLITAGATWADSITELVRRVDTVITMVPGPKEIEAIVRGPGGLIETITPGQFWVDMTTNSPTLVRELARVLRERGARTVDSPVTGAVDGAIQGRLTLFVGGTAADMDVVRPVLETMGRAFHMGECGAGAVTKLLTNQLWFIHAAAIGECLVLGKSSGIDLLTLWDALKNSVADSFVCRHDVPSIFAGHYDPSFTLDLCCKDLDLIVKLAKEKGVSSDLTRLSQSKFELARQTYGGRAAELHVCKLIEDAAKIELRAAGDWPEHWKVDGPEANKGAAQMASDRTSHRL